MAVAACVLLCTLPSLAALGGDVSSVQDDQLHINAARRITQANGYSIHELRSPAGVVVREFASPAGKVFAVAWQTSAFPDLKQLLGAHFEEFQQTVQAQNLRGGHAPLIIHQPDLVVEMGGHMRAFVGRAYLPDEMPAGVRVEDLR
jgi:uncharacterized protein DUF2844